MNNGKNLPGKKSLEINIRYSSFLMYFTNSIDVNNINSVQKISVITCNNEYKQYVKTQKYMHKKKNSQQQDFYGQPSDWIDSPENYQLYMLQTDISKKVDENGYRCGHFQFFLMGH